MSTLYLTDNYLKLSLQESRFVADAKDDCVRKIPMESVESVSVFGNVQITTPCLHHCLKDGIPINFFSTKGAYYGKISSTRHINPLRLKRQVYCADDEHFSLEISKKIVLAKIHNQKVLLKRYQRNNNRGVTEEIRMLGLMENKIPLCREVAEIMGHEGIAARYYFSGLSKLVNEKFAFSGRSKQPPRDPFNSMLSLGYTILLYELYAEIENRGLSPYISFLHSEKNNHPALASDLMEEWRSVVVDAVVMSLVQGNEIDIEDFTQDEDTGGYYIERAAMKKFLLKMNKKLWSKNKYLSQQNISIRRCFYLQSVDITKAIEESNPELYQPIKIW